MTRTGGVRVRGSRFYFRVRAGKSGRPTVTLSGCSTEEEATGRAELIAQVASLLVDAGRSHDVRDYAERLGSARTSKEVAVVHAAARRTAATPLVAAPSTTFDEFIRQWFSGALHRRWPDRVAAKDAHDDESRYRKHIARMLGPMPLKSVTEGDCDDVLSELPSTLSPASRRHVAQIMVRTLRLAAFPARAIEATPLPSGWLPKIGPRKAHSYLYPAEDKKLLGCAAVPLEHRILYGVLAREGLRLGEASGLEWTDLDLKNGSIKLDENKTDDPRVWALSPDVVRVLSRWRKLSPSRPFPARLANERDAERLRSDLKTAGVKRAELFTSTPARQAIRVHDLRATFVTLALANGKSETWVQDRTGHRTSEMVNKYRRAARTAAELGLGRLGPMDKVLRWGKG